MPEIVEQQVGAGSELEFSLDEILKPIWQGSAEAASKEEQAADELLDKQKSL